MMVSTMIGEARSLARRGVLAAALVCVGSACMTTHEGHDLKNDLFMVQKRVLELEHLLSKSGEQSKHIGDEATKRIASTSTRLETLTSDIARLNGEIDTLRMGVITGQLPGVADDQESVAKSISRLQERVEAVEKRQVEILELIEKAQGSGRSASAAGDKRNSLKALADFEKAFTAKRYKHVVADAPAQIAKKKGREQHELKYLFAESLYKMGRLSDAALAFNEIVDAEATGNRKGKIQTRLGDCFRHLGDKKAALIFYQEVVRDYPTSEEAQWANEQIAKIDDQAD